MTESIHQYAHVVTWDDLPPDHPMEKVTRKRIVGSNMMLSHMFLEKEFSIDEHAHPNEQIVVVVSGKITFGINGKSSEKFQRVTITEGQVLVIPPNCPHSAHALEDTLLIDAFSPPSEGTGVDEG
ncbi:MAG: cupin domain-containing protein [Planctomycetota bacterium]|jgi:quercetin dioxygenase-like cupin family protein